MLIVVNNNEKYFAARQQCKLYFNGNTEHSVLCRQAASTPTTIKKWKLFFLRSHGNNGYANGPQYNDVRTWSILL